MQQKLNSSIFTGSKEISSEILDAIVVQLTTVLGANLALKGGFLLSKWFTNPRMTVDLDFSIHSAEFYRTILHKLKNFSETLVAQGVVHSYRLLETIPENRSGGVKYYDINGRVLFGVDISIQPLTVGVGSCRIGLVNVPAYTAERVISDKVSAVLSEKRFRRIKDFYDIYCILNYFTLDFVELKKCLSLRNITTWDCLPFSDDVLQKLQHAWDKFTLRPLKDDTHLEKVDFLVLLEEFYRLTLPILHDKNITVWVPEKHCWR